ncbi:GNAT family N-acetyltransferase [Enterococcus sp. LJL120]
MDLLTQRCRIREFKEKDVSRFAEYHNDSHWMQYQGFKNLSEEEYRLSLLSDKELTQGKQYAIADIQTDELLGDIYLQQEKDGCWLGYSIHPKFSRQGYSYEAVSAMIDFLFQQGYQKIFAEVEIENFASIQLLEKLEFRLFKAETELIYLRTNKKV